MRSPSFVRWLEARLGRARKRIRVIQGVIQHIDEMSELMVMMMKVRVDCKPDAKSGGRIILILRFKLSSYHFSGNPCSLSTYTYHNSQWHLELVHWMTGRWLPR